MVLDNAILKFKIHYWNHTCCNLLFLKNGSHFTKQKTRNSLVNNSDSIRLEK